MALTKPEPPERSKIDVKSATLLKRWAHALGVSREQLKELVEKVGNSAATVRKELDASRKQADEDTSGK
jgi:pyrroloquinoline quinone (PQQ) biosynthesis protein C